MPRGRPLVLSEAQRQARRLGIGGSDAAGVLGLSKYRTPLQVYLDKIGQAPPREFGEEVEWGNRLEDDVIDAYRDRMGVDVATDIFLASDVHPFMLANLDGLASTGRIVEAKTVGYRTMHEWGEEGSDFVPTDYLCQAQHYLIVTGAPACDIAVLFGGQRFSVYTITPDPSFHEILIEREAEFWRHVETRTPPPALAEDAGIMRYAYPVTEEAKRLSNAEQASVDRYEELSLRIKELTEERDGIKAALLQSLAGASRGVLPSGRELRQSVVNVAEHSVKASTYVRFSIHTPKVKAVK